MIVTVFRPDPADGPWLVLTDEGAPRFWRPSPAAQLELQSLLAGDPAGRFEAEQDGDELRLGRRLEIPPEEEP